MNVVARSGVGCNAGPQSNGSANNATAAATIPIEYRCSNGLPAREVLAGPRPQRRRQPGVGRPRRG